MMYRQNLAVRPRTGRIMDEKPNTKREHNPRLARIGARIKARREYLNLSQEQVAAKLRQMGNDISRASFAHCEQGRTPISPIVLEDLAVILKTDLNYFFGLTDDSLSRASRSLPPEKERVVNQLIQLLQGDPEYVKTE